MSSGQTTDVSRTSSFQAQSSFEDARHAQAAQAHRYQQAPPGAAAGGITAGAGLGGPQGSSSLAEHLARAEDKVCHGVLLF